MPESEVGKALVKLIDGVEKMVKNGQELKRSLEELKNLLPNNSNEGEKK